MHAFREEKILKTNKYETRKNNKILFINFHTWNGGKTEAINFGFSRSEREFS